MMPIFRKELPFAGAAIAFPTTAIDFWRVL
jgi:hypothetical protein